MLATPVKFENLVISDKCKTLLSFDIAECWFENLVISDKCKTSDDVQFSRLEV